MIIKNATFITSAARPEQFIQPSKPMIAVCGKSNVGKSSLINMLAGQKRLAKTGAAPGRTRLVNYFDFGEFLLADLPGYGYAEVSKSEKEKWAKTLQSFFERGKDITHALVLVDIRHGATEDDMAMINLLNYYIIPFTVVYHDAHNLEGSCDYVMANPPFNLKGWYDENLKNDSRWADYVTPPESNANYAWILHMLSHLKATKGVAGFLLANGALGDSDTLEIRKKLIQNDKVEAIIILPRELFITTDISVTLWILNQNKKGGEYHGRTLRNRENEILFMDLRTWTENPVKNEGKKKVFLSDEQIQRAADIYHTWQNEGTDGANYAVPELYRSVKTRKWVDQYGNEGLSIEQQGWSLVPSKYIVHHPHRRYPEGSRCLLPRNRPFRLERNR